MMQFPGKRDAAELPKGNTNPMGKFDGSLSITLPKGGYVLRVRFNSLQHRAD